MASLNIDFPSKALHKRNDSETKVQTLNYFDNPNGLSPDKKSHKKKN